MSASIFGVLVFRAGGVPVGVAPDQPARLAADFAGLEAPLLCPLLGLGDGEGMLIGDAPDVVAEPAELLLHIHHPQIGSALRPAHNASDLHGQVDDDLGPTIMAAESPSNLIEPGRKTPAQVLAPIAAFMLQRAPQHLLLVVDAHCLALPSSDRKSTRLNSCH